MNEDQNSQQQSSNLKIMLNQNGQQIELNMEQIAQILQQQQTQLKELTETLEEKDKLINHLQNINSSAKDMNNKLIETIRLWNETTNL